MSGITTASHRLATNNDPYVHQRRTVETPYLACFSNQIIQVITPVRAIIAILGGQISHSLDGTSVAFK